MSAFALLILSGTTWTGEVSNGFGYVIPCFEHGVSGLTPKLFLLIMRSKSVIGAPLSFLNCNYNSSCFVLLLKLMAAITSRPDFLFLLPAVCEFTTTFSSDLAKVSGYLLESKPLSSPNASHPAPLFY